MCAKITVETGVKTAYVQYVSNVFYLELQSVCPDFDINPNYLIVLYNFNTFTKKLD